MRPLRLSKVASEKSLETQIERHHLYALRVVAPLEPSKKLLRANSGSQGLVPTRGRSTMTRCLAKHFAHRPGTSWLVAVLAASFGLFGCSLHTEPRLAAVRQASAGTEPSPPRALFVFLDGTANSGLAKDERSSTNVWRLYKKVKEEAPEGSRAFYVEGVGNARNPLTGMILGKGMEKRIKLGYEFLARNYRPGDSIYIFGFSRGSHQARALAGLISYAGLPVGIDARTARVRHKMNAVVEVAKRHSDADFVSKWASWKEGSVPFLAAEIESEAGLKVQPATIELLGVWDTVPGSLLKNFGECSELPDSKAGDRYKSGSYPPIRQIAHAVSRDEKRNRFALLRVCDAIDPSRTEIKETWFPGAHSDVGGGYDDSKRGVGGPALSNAPFNWMTSVLAAHEFLGITASHLPEDPKALAHWPVGSRLYKAIAKCVDRAEPAEHARHESVQARESLPSAPILVRDQVLETKYPAKCQDLD